MQVKFADFKEERVMSRFIQDLVKAVLGLTAATLLLTTFQVRLADAGVVGSGGVLLTQKAEQEKVQTPSPEPLPQKPPQPAPMEPRQPQMEHMQRKTRSLGPMIDEPAKAGTKKIGGQPIRAKEAPQGE
jgi:hypothetical protein